jgi:hypothetical protein
MIILNDAPPDARSARLARAKLFSAATGSPLSLIANVARAVQAGWLEPDEAADRYGLGPDKLELWSRVLRMLPEPSGAPS